MTRHDELVEEIARYIWGDHEDWEWACREARYLIDRIGKAYAGGELELPNQASIWTPADNWGLRAWARWCLEELSARTFIALSPTGIDRKEER